MDPRKDVTFHISTWSIIKVVLVLLLCAVVFLLRELILLVLTAIVIAAAVEPMIRWFTERRMPRTLAVVLIYLLIGTSLAGTFFFLLPPLFEESSNFFRALPEYSASVNLPGPFSDTPIDAENSGITLREFLFGLQSSLTEGSSIFGTISAIFGGVVGFILVMVFSIYFAIEERNVSDFLRLVTPPRHQGYIMDLWSRSKAKIGLWMQGQLLLAVIVGVLVYLGLVIFDVRFAFLLAIIAGLFEIIPIFGPILAAIPAVMIGFIDGGVTLMILVLGLYLIIQQFENHLIYPLVVTKVVGVPPLLVILFLLAGGTLAGFLGVILSVPAAAVVQELVHDLERRRLRANGGADRVGQ